MNKRLLFLPIAILLSVVSVTENVRATVHTVTFTCCQYTPSNFSASVGDTVLWLGDFAFHPLQSTTIPSGADPFSNNSGTTFSYTILVAGTYNYHCFFHQPPMAGSFTATIVGVQENPMVKSDAFRLYQNYPNPFNPNTTMSFTIDVTSFTSLKVYDIAGNEVATLTSEKKEPGNYTVTFDGTSLSSGIYLYRLQAGDFSATRKLLLLK